MTAAAGNEEGLRVFAGISVIGSQRVGDLRARIKPRSLGAARRYRLLRCKPGNTTAPEHALTHQRHEFSDPESFSVD